MTLKIDKALKIKDTSGIINGIIKLLESDMSSEEIYERTGIDLIKIILIRRGEVNISRIRLEEAVLLNRLYSDYRSEKAEKAALERSEMQSSLSDTKLDTVGTFIDTITTQHPIGIRQKQVSEIEQNSVFNIMQKESNITGKLIKEDNIISALTNSLKEHIEDLTNILSNLQREMRSLNKNININKQQSTISKQSIKEIPSVRSIAPIDIDELSKQISKINMDNLTNSAISNQISYSSRSK